MRLAVVSERLQEAGTFVSSIKDRSQCWFRRTWMLFHCVCRRRMRTLPQVRACSRRTPWLSLSERRMKLSKRKWAKPMAKRLRKTDKSEAMGLPALPSDERLISLLLPSGRPVPFHNGWCSGWSPVQKVATSKIHVPATGKVLIRHSSIARSALLQGPSMWGLSALPQDERWMLGGCVSGVCVGIMRVMPATTHRPEVWSCRGLPPQHTCTG